MTSLPRSTPAEQQVDARAVLRVLDVLEAHPDVEMHSLMVLCHGRVVAEGWWAPYTSERKHLVYSISKSFAMTAALLAHDERLLDLEDTVLSHFPELDAEVVDERSRRTTLRHVAAMASGHERDLQDLLRTFPDEPVRALLLTPPDAEPGTLFAYNQLCTYALAAVVQRVSGQRLTEYLRPRLFEPLGIGEVGWQEWPGGRELGFSGLHARTEDLARLGQLYLQRGRWGGRQLLPEELVAEATRAQVDNAQQQPSVDWQQGYGWQFWMSRHGYRGDGAFGQFCVVLPEQDVVVAATACTEQMQEVLDALWTHLLPGLTPARADLPAGSSAGSSAEAELRERLAALTLPPVPATSARGRTGTWSLPVTPGPKVLLESVEVTAGSEVSLSLVEAGNRIDVPVGLGEWAVSEPVDASGDVVPVAASGTWDDDGTLRVEVLFLETPHRLDLRCDVSAAAARAAWRLVPLGSTSLGDLRSP